MLKEIKGRLNYHIGGCHPGHSLLSSRCHIRM